jgi:DNA-binding PadR family transcriptional regulator
MRRPDPAVPAISHLQAVALGALLSSDQPGRVIREHLKRYGARRTAAAFYQMMARLERDGLVEGWYQQIQSGDQAVTERWYRVTAAGRRAWHHTRAFYESVARTAEGRLSNA